MTPEQWARIEALYQGAVELPDEARAGYLAAQCGQDEMLRREVEALLDEPVSGDGIGPLQPVRLGQALHASMSGRRLGGYDLGPLLGSGGMGEVYRASDAALGRDVAIKILPSALAGDPDRLARLEREARSLAALNHPNICAIYGVGEAEGIRFLILELVAGQTLAERLDAAHPDAAEATAIARQIVDALAAAHSRGIVHRDLKPANIKITPEGIVKLLDFGLAKSIGSGEGPGLTHVPAAGAGGALLGTAAYMSPEQARGQAVDGRTDVWAFGAVLYEMLAGQPAFAGDTTSDTIARILEREPDWTRMPRETPGGLHRLMRRCLVKDARRRLKDIADARLDLDGIGESVADAAVQPGETARWTAGRLLPWTALLVLAAGVAVREGTRSQVPVRPLNPLDIETVDYKRITQWDGTESGAVISPDGRLALFASDRDRRFDLFLTQIGTQEASNLTEKGPPVDAPGIVRTFGFTPDGEIWYTAGRASGQQGVWIMPQTGGTSRPFLGGLSTGPAWSNDGTRVAYFEFVAGDPISVVDRTGADPKQILAPEKGRHNHHLVWSTDDQWIYFVSGYLYGLDGADAMDVWRIRPSGGPAQRVTRLNTAATYLTALDPRTWLFVARSLNRTGPWLWAFDDSSPVPRRVSSGLEQYTSVSASRDGRQIIATHSRTTINLWRVPVHAQPAGEAETSRYPGMTTPASTPRFGRGDLFHLSTGPGATIDGVFRVEDGGLPARIWSADDGTLSEPPAISRDGAQVALVLRKDGGQQLMVMAADGTARRRVAADITIQGAADWSMDGSSLLVGGADRVGSALFEIPLNGGASRRIIEGDAVNPVLLADGETIVYSETIVRGVAPLHAIRRDGARLPIPPLQARPGSYRAARAGRALIYLPTPNSPNFWSFDFETRQTRAITALADLGRLRMFDISPTASGSCSTARRNSQMWS